VLTHRVLLQDVWGKNYDDQDAALLRRVITELRKKIEPNPSLPKYIITEPGIGYRFVFDP
jgi:two-component system KDP operon response regulator KdpE